eukprot:scaffold1141_cov128-Isochrysis_galbana.AAC.5
MLSGRRGSEGGREGEGGRRRPLSLLASTLGPRSPPVGQSDESESRLKTLRVESRHCSTQ